MSDELAGDRIKMVESADGTTTFIFDNVGTGRVCGQCQLCCKLLPLPPLGKPSGKRCQHQRTGKGCMIYTSRPRACKTFACRWLADPATAGMPRPDRAHYVIDPTWDYVRLLSPSGEEARVSVMQVWVDPAFHDAHRAPELRAFILRMAEQHSVGMIVRWDSRQALTILPPPLWKDGKWHEITGMPEERDPPVPNVVGIEYAP